MVSQYVCNAEALKQVELYGPDYRYTSLLVISRSCWPSVTEIDLSSIGRARLPTSS